MNRRGETGYALLTALMVLLLVSIALGLLGASLQLRMRLVRADGVHVILSALSDAAVAESLAHLAADPSYSGSPEHDFGGGKIASQVFPVGAGIFGVLATAEYAGSKRTVEAEVIRPPGAAPRVRRWRRLPG